MAPGPFRRIWLALLLLAATFSSAPLGSMEQGGLRGSQGNAQAGSVPALRPGLTLRVEKVKTVPGRPPPAEASRPYHPCALPGLEAEAPPAGTVPGGPERARESRARPLCERLPYDPNAPPSASARVQTT